MVEEYVDILLPVPMIEALARRGDPEKIAIDIIKEGLAELKTYDERRKKTMPQEYKPIFPKGCKV
jgi:hypothetical protein